MRLHGKRLALAATAVVPACAATAQTAQVDFTLAWAEVYAGSNLPVGNPNGMLDPGEAARISISAAFTPVGAPVVYQFPSPGGVAPVAGLSASTFNLVATNALGGDWSNFTLRHGFGGGLPLFTDPVTGSLGFSVFGQAYPPLGSWPVATNPLIDVWEAVWTPPSYTQRQARFAMERPVSWPPTHPRLFVYIGNDPGGNPMFGIADAIGGYDSVEIPIVPAPSAAMLLTVLAAGAAYKRRR